MELEVSAADSVLVEGLVDGLPVSETVVFTVPGSKRTVNRFDSFTSISGLVELEAFAVGMDGSRIDLRSVVVEQVRTHRDWMSGTRPIPGSGSVGVQVLWFGLGYSSAWSVRRGDIIMDGEFQYVVEKAELLYGGSQKPHHWEIHVRETHGGLPVS